jgi:Glycosyltransferase WbsX
MTKQITNPAVFAYYFPNYHRDARNEKKHGEGWTEWDLLKAARPRFPGHYQPKVPLWGCEDEADPLVMAKKIDAAASHGLTGFIFDWYFYEDGPFLGRALDEGFLGAANNDQLKFALMWANHDWVNLFPATIGETPSLFYPGGLSLEGWDRLTDFVVEKYFSHPSYWLIDGCPYFSIYEMASFIKGIGGLDHAVFAMNAFREKVRKAGFPDLHLNIVAWGLSESSFAVLPVEQRAANPVEAAQALGTRSVTPYVWVHHFDLSPHFPRVDFETVAQVNYESWETLSAMPFAFFPNVTMGWDPSPRTNQSREFENVGYPYHATMEGTPAAFQAALVTAKHWVEKHPGTSGVITINAWNEWTEGSYLEPDTRSGMAYLTAIKDVFGAV